MKSEEFLPVRPHHTFSLSSQPLQWTGKAEGLPPERASSVKGLETAGVPFPAVPFQSRSEKQEQLRTSGAIHGM